MKDDVNRTVAQQTGGVPGPRRRRRPCRESALPGRLAAVLLRTWFPVIAAFLVASSFWGCDSLSKTPEEFFQRGRAAFEKGEYRVALIELKNAVQKKPDFLEARFLLGRTYLKTEKPASAEREFRRIRQKDASFAGIELPLARALLGQRKLELCLEILEPFLEQSPRDAEALETAAAARFALGQDGEARVLIDRSLASAPDRITARLLSARIFLAGKHNGEARKDIETAVELDPAATEPLLLLARLESAEERADESLSLYEKVLKADPKNLAALMESGVLLVRRGDLDAAAGKASRLLSVAAKRPEGHYLRGLVHFRRGEMDEAIIDLQTVLKSNPDHVFANLFLGQALIEKGRLEQAIDALRRAREEGEDLFQPSLLLATIYQRKGRVEDAVKAAAEAVRKAPALAVTHHALGLALMAAGRLDRGMAELDRATDLDPSFVDSYLSRGVYYLRAGRGDKAASQIDAALEVAPDSLRLRFAAAAFYLRQKKYAKALETCRAGLQGEATDALLYNVMGSAHRALSKPDEAVADYRKAIELAPSFAAPYVNLATHFVSEGKTQDALALYHELQQKAPKNPEGYLKAAALLARLGRSDEIEAQLVAARDTGTSRGILALAAYYARSGRAERAGSLVDDVLTREPENIEARDLKGMLLVRQKDLAAARKEFEKITESRPELVAGYMKLAAVYASAGETEKALAEVNKAETRAKDNPLVLAQKAGILLKNGSFSEARAVADRLIKTIPGKGSGYYLKALGFLGEGQADRALALMEKARRTSPRNLQFLMALGGLRLDRGENPRALELFEAARTEAPTAAVVHYSLGMVYERLGRIDDAVAAYREAVNLQPGHVPALNNLAFLLADHGRDIGRAVELARKAYTGAGGHPSVADTLGWALLKAGKADEAATFLREAVAAAPNNPSIRYHQAELALAMGHRDEARDALERALKGRSFPERARAEKMLGAL